MLRVVKCTCSGLPQGRALCSASAFVSRPLYFLGVGSGWGGCLELVFSQLPKQPHPLPHLSLAWPEVGRERLGVTRTAVLRQPPEARF